MPLADLVPYAKNARKNDATVPELVEDIKQVGYISPIIVDENNEVLAGHTRLRALQALGRKEAEILRVTGLQAAQKRKFRLYDNKVGEKSEWDFDLLAQEIADLDFGDLDLDWDIPEIVPEEEDKWVKNTKSKNQAYYGATRERSFEQWNFLDYDPSRVEGKYNIPTNKPTQHRPKALVGFDHMLTSTEYDKGVHEARSFLNVWDAMQPFVDAQRFSEVQRKLRIQARDAEWWRDACLLYFQTFSRRPIPQDMEHPVHNLDEMMQFSIPIGMYVNPDHGYTK